MFSSDLDWETMQIEVRGEQKFDDLNRNKVNRGNVNRNPLIYVAVGSKKRRRKSRYYSMLNI